MAREDRTVWHCDRPGCTTEATCSERPQGWGRVQARLPDEGPGCTSEDSVLGRMVDLCHYCTLSLRYWWHRVSPDPREEKESLAAADRLRARQEGVRGGSYLLTEEAVQLGAARTGGASVPDQAEEGPRLDHPAVREVSRERVRVGTQTEEDERASMEQDYRPLEALRAAREARERAGRGGDR